VSVQLWTTSYTKTKRDPSKLVPTLDTQNKTFSFCREVPINYKDLLRSPYGYIDHEDLMLDRGWETRLGIHFRGQAVEGLYGLLWENTPPKSAYAYYAPLLIMAETFRHTL
jgi:hypothetical protein